MKRILNTLAQKWPEYLLEILVLIIGIYGAFLLDNWNDTRKERQREKDYAIRFIQDLKRDTANFSMEIKEAVKKYTAGKEAYQFIVDEKYIIQDTTDFLIQLQGIGRTDKPRIHKNTYDDLVSTGNSAIITDKEVLDEILTYYNTIPTEWFDKEYLDRMWKGYLPNAIDALDLNLMDTILKQDSLSRGGVYTITLSDKDAIRMLIRFKNNSTVEFETKNVTRTHLVHSFHLLNTKDKATSLLNTLNDYVRTIN